METSERLPNGNTSGKISDRVGDETPELVLLSMKNNFLHDTHDGLYDLTEDEIKAIALLRTFNKNIIKIPATMTFCEEYASLTRSRERAGRQEGVTIFRSPLKYIQTPFHSPDEEETGGKGGFLSKIRGK